MAKKLPAEDTALAGAEASKDDGVCNRCSARKLAGERFLFVSGDDRELLCQDCYDQAKSA